MSYFDFTVYAVPNDEKDKLVAFARQMDALFVEYGALRVVDCWGDDVPPGKATDFYRSVAAEAGETVCVGFVEWPSKDVRGQAWAKLEADPRMADVKLPFDGKRMIFGGFSTLVDMRNQGAQ